MLTGRDCRPIFQGKGTSIKVAGSGLRIRPLTRIRSEKRLLTSRLGFLENWDREIRPNGEYCWLAHLEKTPAH